MPLNVRDTKLNAVSRTQKSSTPSSTDGVVGAPQISTAQADLPVPEAQIVAGAVGGKALSGPVLAVRLPGRDVDVLFPAQGASGDATFATYVERLEKSGAFAGQAKRLGQLQKMKATTATLVADHRPTVGIVLSEAKMLVPGAHENTENIIALVEKMGCRPVLIPPCADLLVSGGPQARARAIAALTASLDGLVGPGGEDVDPSIYGEANTASVHTNVFRDTFEADFARAALDCELFAFGICRSHQLWNAAAGGSLIQDVQDEKVVSVSHKGGVFHPLMVKKHSMIFEATRQQMLRVNSYHHQAVDFAGWGFRVVGSTRDAGTGKDMIEATERWNGITTQYHPELMQDDPAQRALFETLGRRAHVFVMLKALRKEGTLSLPQLLERMRTDPRFNATDVAWAKRELGRRL